MEKISALAVAGFMRLCRFRIKPEVWTDKDRDVQCRQCHRKISKGETLQRLFIEGQEWSRFCSVECVKQYAKARLAEHDDEVVQAVEQIESALQASQAEAPVQQVPLHPALVTEPKAPNLRTA